MAETQASPETELMAGGDAALEFGDFYSEMSKNVDQIAEIKISRLAMLQPQSPEITRQVQGYKQGMIVDNQSREILSISGKPPWMVAAGIPEGELNDCFYLPVLPVFKLPTEFIQWTPRKERKPGDPNYKFKTLDAADNRVRAGTWPPRGTWGKEGSGQTGSPPVTDNTNILILPLAACLTMAKATFTIATFSRTSAKTGHTFVKAITVTHQLQKLFPWDRIYYLYTKQEPNSEGVHYEFNLAPGPLSKPHCSDLWLQAKAMGFQLMKPVTGPVAQAAMLNAAAQVGDESHDPNNEPNNEPIDPNTVNGTMNQGTDNPFPDEAVTEPQF